MSKEAWNKTVSPNGEINYHSKINGKNAYIKEYKSGHYTMYTEVFAFNCICDTFEEAEKILEDELK